ncbi:MAG: hypothetical protein EA424_27740 [Planctomycetaceae bacterium]|nr:MAG: hypothetical protein EA424_27740 [Planctomycetaceae bacterium]
MLSRVTEVSHDSRQLVMWEELGAGAPTLMAFAQLCSGALVNNRTEPDKPLDDEARAILYAARHRGFIEIKGVNHAFESSERFLTVCVELDLERQLIFKRRDDPELTIRFLDGFRQLCAGGLVMHHIYRDFSLTRAGFERARAISKHSLTVLTQLAEEQHLGEI